MMWADDDVLPSRKLFMDDIDDFVTLDGLHKGNDHCSRRSQRSDKNSKKQHSEGSPRKARRNRRTSPVSVEDHPSLGLRHGLSPLSSKITMSEEGAEVTVDFTSLSLDSPHTRHQDVTIKRNKKREDMKSFRRNSLLDIDSTPAKSERTKKDPVTPICCGLQAEQCWQDDTSKDVNDMASQMHLERTISMLLGRHQPGAGFSAWQTWSYFGGLMAPVEETGGISDEDIRKVFRNRAGNLAGRKLKIRQLKHNMNPFSPSTPEKHRPSVSRSKSFSIKDHAPAIVRVSESRELSNGIASILTSCTLPPTGLSEGKMEIVYTLPTQEFSASPYLMSGQDEEDCYDSDPEEFTTHRSRARSKNADDKENWMAYKNYSFPRTVSFAPTGAELDMENDAAYRAVVQEFMNETATLLLHPSPKSGHGLSPSSPPVAVNVWIERGQLLQTLIHPKLMWRPVYQPDQRHRKTMAVPNVSSMELLDITRILKVNRIDRAKQPFAKPMHCFIIKTIEEDELFLEARSFSERNRFVYSLKLLVARLGAKVIVADPVVFAEFFNSAESVPGKAPLQKLKL